MCGRFAQAQSREEYWRISWKRPNEILHGTRRLSGAITSRPGQKFYSSMNAMSNSISMPFTGAMRRGWWDKPPLINARVETAASSRMFKPLWEHGRAICFADGWFEWKKEGNKKQPYFIQRKDDQPIFMAAIGRTPFERGDHAEGFLIVTAAADRGLVDIHDRRPLVLTPEAAREWMRQDVTGAEAAEIASDGAVSADDFTWHPVTRAVGNVKNQGPELLAPLSP